METKKNKQEVQEVLIDITANPDDTEWWQDVQTFDFGIQIGTEEEQEKRFADVSEEEVRKMAKKKMLSELMKQLNLVLRYCQIIVRMPESIFQALTRLFGGLGTKPLHCSHPIVCLRGHPLSEIGGL